MKTAVLAFGSFLLGVGLSVPIRVILTNQEVVHGAVAMSSAVLVFIGAAMVAIAIEMKL